MKCPDIKVLTLKIALKGVVFVKEKKGGRIIMVFSRFFKVFLLLFYNRIDLNKTLINMIFYQLKFALLNLRTEKVLKPNVKCRYYC